MVTGVLVFWYGAQRSRTGPGQSEKPDWSTAELHMQAARWQHQEPIPQGVRADLVRVEKAARRLTLWHQGDLLKEYRVALGWNPVGPKEREGDGRTPEGHYRISGRNPASRFHLSLRISYPSAEDRARASAGGYAPGGDIMIHGLPPGASKMDGDWTAGCVAVSNAEIEEIWRVVPDGTAVEILP